MFPNYFTPAWLLFAASLQFHPSKGGTFWHISDLHLDYEYVTGGNVSDWCHKPSSETSGGETSSFNKEVGPAGNYNCDSPLDLVMSALEAMHNFKSDPDFIVWTGDSAPHWKNPTPNESYIFNVTQKVFTKLDELFPSVTVVPALGNHDAYPPDQFPINGENEYYKDLWQKGAFGDHIDKDSMQLFQTCGYYTKVINNTLKFIVLNTNIYYGDDLSIGTDPCDQMDWFNKTLINSPESQTVFVVAHVPPGAFERGGKDGWAINFNTPNDTYHDINKRYVQIVTDNAKKISGHLYGHLHTDTFRIFLDRAQSKEARGVGFMAGSVTPVVWAKDGDSKTGVVGTNPSIRLFEYRDSDYRLMDYSVYNLDVIEANKKNDQEEVLTLNSSASDTDKDATKNDDNELVLMNGNNRKRRETNDDVVNSETTGEISKAEDAKSISIAAEFEPRAEEVEDDDNSTAVTKTESAVTESSPVLAVNPDEVTSGPVVELQTIIPDVPVILDNNQDDNISMSQMTTTAPPVPKPDLRKAEINEVSVNVSSPDEPSNNIQNLMAVKNLTSQWKLLYKATEAFRVTDLSPTSMFGAVKWMVNETYSGDMFQTYYKHNTAGHKWGTCEVDCWRQHLCSITKLVEKEIKTCLNETDKHGFYYEEPNKNETKPFDIIIPSPQEMESSTDGIVIEPRPEDPDSIATRAVSIFFGIVGVLLILLVVFFGYKKYKESRYRNQEFLLTDSVFRYDGYSQLDDD